MLVVGASATGTQIAEELHRSGPAGHARGRRAHSRAPRLPGPRHQVVDGRRRRAGRSVRRDRRHRPRPQRAVAAAGRFDGPPDRRSQSADRPRRAPRRPPGRHRRRQGAVLGIAAQPVRALRPQDEPAARPDRRVGDRARARRRRRSAAPLRAHPGRGLTAARDRSSQRRDSNRDVGDRFPSRLLLAGRAGARPQGSHPARRRRRRVARHVPDGPPVPAAAQVQPHRRRRGRRARPERSSRAESRSTALARSHA